MMKNVNFLKTAFVLVLLITVTTLSAKNDTFSEKNRKNITQKSDIILYEDFENGINENGSIIFEGWSLIDADGDGFNWGNPQSSYEVFEGYNSTHCAFSGSYIGYHGVLTPDNYLITPLVEGAKSVNYWVCAQDAVYAADHYAVMASTTGTAAEDFVLVFEETMTGKGPGAWCERTVDLPESTRYIAWRHYNCTDMYFLKLDDITVYNKPAEPDIILHEDFEKELIPNGWTTIDADGDNFGWGDFNYYYGEYLGYNSQYCTYSASYLGNVGGLTPDNYLISPLVRGAESVNYWVCAQDEAWAAEHYAVMASTTGTAAEDFVTVFEETMTAKGPGAWYERTVFLPEGTRYIAWRHYNCTDMYFLKLDEVTVYGTPLPVMEPVTDFTATRVKNNIGSLKWNYPNGYQTNNKGVQLTGYKIYADNTLLAELNDMHILQYTDSTYFARGTMPVEYCITAVYDELDESEAVCKTLQFATTSIDNLQWGHTLKIYPNPATNYIRVEGLPDGKSTIELYNTIGIRVQQKQVNTTDTEIDVSSLSKGIYLLKIMSAGRTKTEKIEIK